MAEESGITISEFYLLNIVLPEGDPTYQRLKELHLLTMQKEKL